MIDLILTIAIPSAFGGLVRGLVGVSKSILSGKKTLSPSKMSYVLLISTIVGVVAGLLFEGLDWRILILIGYGGSDVIENIYKMYIFSKTK